MIIFPEKDSILFKFDFIIKNNWLNIKNKKLYLIQNKNFGSAKVADDFNGEFG